MYTLSVPQARAFRVFVPTVAVIGIFFLFLYTSLTTAIFGSVFIIWAVWRLDSRYVGGAGLALLVAIPVILSLGKDEWDWLAEQFAVYVFFLLCITVGLQIIEMAIESRTSNVERGGTKETCALVNYPILHEQPHTSRAHAPPRPKHKIFPAGVHPARPQPRSQAGIPHKQADSLLRAGLSSENRRSIRLKV